ncbi:MAG: hypothetical protein KME04_20815 [Pleurocapsa minor GSE-CHR-MK-17-07R]|jgi:hypothetical protein|nr:hypothetical protein [Pleurocapsa minor GSE-CHR-MK 17-07R]
MMSRRLWTTVFLAAMLAFGSEILLWPHAGGRSVIGWISTVIGYPALAGLLLALAERFRMRDLFGLMALAGVYGVLNGLLITPDTALADIPRTWFTRMMGAHAFVGLLMLGLFLTLQYPWSRTKIIALGVITALLGVAFGVWGRWAPELYGAGGEVERLPLQLVSMGVCLLIVLTGTVMASRPQTYAPNSRLSVFAPALALFGILIMRLLEGTLDSLSLVVTGTFALLAVGVLYYQKRQKGPTLLDGLNTLPADQSIYYLGMYATFLYGGGYAGYFLERGTGSGDPVYVIGVIFLAYGIVWLPAVAVVLGARAFIRLSRQGRL